MTLLDPTLILNRLVVTRGNNTLYDEAFHQGVNIIRGDNASGKTTIVDFIIHSLGGKVLRWTDEALLADYVFAEYSFSGSIYTLKRAVEDGDPAIDFYECDFASIYEKGVAPLRYKHKRSDERESFSQAIFKLLSLPEQKTDNNSNITINDILRLIYEDQDTATTDIFRDDRDVDSGFGRQAVAEILLGLDDLALHRLRLDYKKADNEFREAKAELSSIFRILGEEGKNITVQRIQSEIFEYQNQREELNKKIEAASTKEMNDRERKTALKQSEHIRNQIIKLRSDIDVLARKKSSWQFEIEDSKEFIESIGMRLNALSASNQMRKSLGELQFDYCPACLSTLQDIDATHCHLCKESYGEEVYTKGFQRMQNELLFQKRESELLLKDKIDELRTIETRLSEKNNEKKKLESENWNLISTLNPIEAEIKDLYSQLGYVQKAMEDANAREHLARKINDLSNKKESLNGIMTRMDNEIKALEASHARREAETKTKIAESTLGLLSQDLSNEFRDVDTLKFDFKSNYVSVAGKNRTAASSTTFLKNCFLFSIFLSSLELKYMRFPRFIILDNIEDKGLADSRIRNFHDLIISNSKKYLGIEHQIIFTASTPIITDELDRSEYCVGDHYYDEDGKRSLKLKGS